MNKLLHYITTLLLNSLLLTFSWQQNENPQPINTTQLRIIEYNMTEHQQTGDTDLREDLEFIASKDSNQLLLGGVILKSNSEDNSSTIYKNFIFTDGQHLDKQSHYMAHRLGYKLIQQLNQKYIVYTLLELLAQNPQKAIDALAFNHPICPAWHYLLSIIYPEGKIQLAGQACDPQSLIWPLNTMIMQYLSQKIMQSGNPLKATQKILGIFAGNTAAQLSYLQEENKVLHRKLNQKKEPFNQASWPITFIPRKTLRYTHYVMSATFSSNGQLFASTDYNEVYIYNSTNYKLLTKLQGHTSVIWSVIFSPHGEQLATDSRDRTVRIYSATNYQLLKEIKEGISWVHTITFSPNSQYLIVVDNQVIHIYDTTTYQLLRKLENDKEPFRCVAFSPDGIHLALGSKNLIYIYDTINYQLLKKVDHIGQAWCIVFSPDGNLVATKSSNGNVYIYGTINYQLLQVIKQKDELTSLAFSPDSKLLAIGSNHGHIYLYDIPTYQLFETLQKHKYFISSVNFSPDGKKLISSCYGNTVDIWELGNLPSISQL